MFGSEPAIGTAANRYVLGNLIGRGAMAEVFAGYVNGLHGFKKPVAIKRLLPALATNRALVERLITEAKVLVGMHHGNIVSVLDLAHDDNNVFIVLEHVDGPSLRQFLHARGPRSLPLATATYIIQSAAAGLEFAHTLPAGAIVHADISPSNLLLTTSGEVRVADFGIALRGGSVGGAGEGEWTYTAPEQLRGEPLSRSSDVFALGAVLYELLTGRYPFGTTRREHAEIASPRTINPSVPAGLDAICMRALAHDPCDRFGRMQHVIDALLDVRFDNQWRDGPNELARAIRESGGVGAPPRQDTLVTSRPIALMTRSLVAVPPEVDDQTRGVASGEQTVIVDMPPIPPSGLPVVAPAFEIDGQNGRARWADAKRNPHHMFAAWLPAPELSTIHSRHEVPATRRRGAMRAMHGNWIVAIAAGALLGIVVFFAMRGELARGAPETVPSAARRVRVAETHATAIVPRPPVFHVAMPSPEPPLPAAGSPPTHSEASNLPPPSNDVPGASTPPVHIDGASRPSVSPGSADGADTTLPLPAAGPPTVLRTPAQTPQLEDTHDNGRPAADVSSPTVTTHPRNTPVAADATLRVNTINQQSVWAFAYLDGVRREVPGAKFKATPGRHVVKLENPKLDLGLSCVVTLVSHRTASLNVDLQSGRCQVIAAR